MKKKIPALLLALSLLLAFPRAQAAQEAGFPRQRGGVLRPGPRLPLL